MDPGFRHMLDKLAQGPQWDWRRPMGEIRRNFWQMVKRMEADAPAMLEQRSVEPDGAEGKLKARLYVPHAVGVGDGPGVVYFHGGGFAVGDIESHDIVCRRLADAGKMRVLSVEYRLAPEHKFPAAPEDCVAATRWAFEKATNIGFDPARIGVAGDSAGGNLSAVVAQQFKKRGFPRLGAQCLIYPCTQFLQMTPSQIRFKEGYALTQAAQDWFKDMYLGGKESALDTRASPLLENDLYGLPPAYVVTAGFDPLFDEGRAYAEKLSACGVVTVYKEYGDQIHGFFNMTAVSKVAKDAIADCGRWLKATLDAQGAARAPR
jgi:acetyl esterase